MATNRFNYCERLDNFITLHKDEFIIGIACFLGIAWLVTYFVFSNKTEIQPDIQKPTVPVPVALGPVVPGLEGLGPDFPDPDYQGPEGPDPDFPGTEDPKPDFPEPEDPDFPKPEDPDPDFPGPEDPQDNLCKVPLKPKDQKSAPWLQALYKSSFYNDDEIFFNFKSDKWPNNTIPYKIDPDFSESIRDKTLTAMSEIEKSVGCIKFLPLNDDDNQYHIRFTNHKVACNSELGYVKARIPSRIFQQVNLESTKCDYIGVIRHELIHSLGFVRMQNTKCRDKYITICWDNIDEDHRKYFETQQNSTDFGLGYDFTSITHSKANIYAIDKSLPTMVSKTGETISQSGTISELDIRKIKMAYNCDGDNPLPTEC